MRVRGLGAANPLHRDSIHTGYANLTVCAVVKLVFLAPSCPAVPLGNPKSIYFSTNDPIDAVEIKLFNNKISGLTLNYPYRRGNLSLGYPALRRGGPTDPGDLSWLTAEFNSWRDTWRVGGGEGGRRITCLEGCALALTWIVCPKHRSVMRGGRG